MSINKLSKNQVIKIVLSITAVVICLLYLKHASTYASYESEVNGNVKSKIANWNILINNENITSSENKTININDITWTNSHITENKVGPGSVGQIVLEIDPTTTDVAFKYDLRVIDKRLDDKKILTLTSIYPEDLDMMRTDYDTYSAIFTINQIKAKKKKKVTLFFEWISDDETDKNYINSTNDDFIELELTASQHSGKALSPYKNFSVGDYIQMTPKVSSFTTDPTKTGYTEAQEINPSELSLWRVIRVNGNESVDVVSEETSSVNIYFSGQTGYKNLVGYLNEIAKQYENDEFSIGSRITGYSPKKESLSQTEYITDDSYFLDSAPWKETTKDNSNELQGGGDTLYDTDVALIRTATMTTIANKAGTTTPRAYWLGSRVYEYSSDSDYSWSGRHISTTGALGSSGLLEKTDILKTDTVSRGIRPILTLKPGLKKVGTGTKTDPFVLN